MILANTFRLKAAMCVLTAFSLVLVPAAKAQALTVLPVNVFLAPGQNATSLAVTNSGQSETAVQIRAYAWNENDGSDQLVDTDEVLLSPPTREDSSRSLAGRAHYFAALGEAARGNLSHFD